MTTFGHAISAIVAPLLLRWRIARVDVVSTAEPRHEALPEPIGGWLVAADERISLAGSPGAEHVLSIALPTALAMAEGRTPDSDLVAWLHRTADAGTVSWTSRTTFSFLRLLEFGTPRSWTFLDATGVLRMALPELASAMSRRRSDPVLLDPAGVDRFPILEKVQALRRGIVDHSDEQPAVRALALLDHPERVLLAALLIDCCAKDQVCTQAILERLCLERAVLEEAGALTTNQQLLVGTAIRPDGLTAESVLRLAVHLGDEQRAAALYVLTVAVGGLERWQRAALEELQSMLSLTLAGQRHGMATAAILEQRRRGIRELAGTSFSATALGRINSAPISYLLSTDPDIVVRHLSLLTQLKQRGRFAATVTGSETPGCWQIDLAAHDAIGLLAEHWCSGGTRSHHRRRVSRNLDRRRRSTNVLGTTGWNVPPES